MDQLDPIRVRSRRARFRLALLALTATSALAMIGAGAASLAVFTDSKASGGTWTAGTIILGVSPTTAFTATGIMPGATGNQTITVSNTGTGALRYALSSTSTNPDTKALAAQLDLTIQAGTCAAPTATLFTGKLSAAALGSNAQGAQAGDRTVAAAATDNLCFAWSFPLASGNGYQSATTTTTFTFDAEQTANNP